jgi:putative transposase
LENHYIYSLQTSLKYLDNAYIGFFNKRTKFPRFKSKKSKNSFKVLQFVKLENNKLKIPKFKEPINLILSRKFTGKIINCIISKTTTNEYFVSFLVETEHNKLPKTGKSVGIDLGIKDFVITSDGYKYKNNRYTKKYERTLKKNQQHLSRKKKQSNRYEEQRLKVAKLHKKITNS